MNLNEIARAAPIIPVLTIDSLSDAVPLAQALVEGGLPVLEITLRTPVALAAIELIAKSVPKAIVGVGTVTNTLELQASFDHGATFAISPGITFELVQFARDHKMNLIPGTQSPSDIMLAKSCGFNIVKFFPAEQSGGIAMLKAFYGPFSDIEFIPTGGITADSARHYLDLPNVLAVGGSWLAPKVLVQQQNWAAIKELAAQARKS